MGKLKRDMFRKKLSTLLSRADDESFFQLIWAIDALQTGREAEAAKIITFPDEAATSDMASPFAMHKWVLETLIGQLLVISKARIREGYNKRTNCGQFNTGAVASNHLREIENSEASIYLRYLNIFIEMHRIAQRQFPWQHGYSGVSRFYRYALIYGQGKCDEYFKRTHDLSINEFSLVGFALYAAFQKHHCLTSTYSLKELGVDSPVFDAALSLLSKPILQARKEADGLVNEAGRGLPTAFQPSFLRRFPIISFGKDCERLRAALPELIPLRITSGLYYDLLPGGQGLLNDANDRFETYARDYIAAMMPRFSVCRSHQYGPKGREKSSPDVIVKDNDKISIVIECKATRLTFPAQYTEDPAITAKRAYDQIAKGVFQLWKYFSHVRRSIDADARISPNVSGIVLTLDMWLAMAANLQKDVIKTAHELADKDPDIITDDRREIVFCSIDDLEYVLSYSNEDEFLASLAAAIEDRFIGWVLPDIYRKVAQQGATPKPFPFSLGEVLPWWQRLPA